ncbi:MAG TPA: crossover junction endodeoxyribonuclease RuvC, partial [Armatimonadetes bacterium]|nr:crossover junction endodeoxyribonuclease RuvC [Armatimonadota bacterium]
MVLLGVDPGLAATGWGLVQSTGPRPASLGYGCLRTSAGEELGVRLLTIHDAIAGLLREHRPAALALERLYQLRDGSTGLAVGQAVGVIRLAAAQAGVPVAEYTPTHVKMTIVGHGQAEKHQVQFMVQRLLNLDELPRPDHAADALALSLTHLFSGLSRAQAPSAAATLAPPGGAAPLPDRLAQALAADD